MTAVLERLLRPGGRRRSPSDFFAHADRLRREGRYPEAATLVASGLALDPNSVTGHLLAAYLHVAQRTIEPAKREFRWVLGRDPSHPRALLGLARIALEEGDLVGCRECLGSALRAYPDFPEASAVLDALAAPPTSATPTTAPPRLERLRLPGAARALVLVDAQGRALVELPAAEDGGPRLPRIAGLASAALKRAGFGRAPARDHRRPRADAFPPRRRRAHAGPGDAPDDADSPGAPRGEPLVGGGPARAGGRPR